MHRAVAAQHMRSALPDPVARGGFDCRLHDPGMIGEPQVVIAAERQALPPVDDDSRPLRALADEAGAAQTAALELGELVDEALKDQGRTLTRKAAWFTLAV